MADPDARAVCDEAEERTRQFFRRFDERAATERARDLLREADRRVRRYFEEESRG